MTRSTDYSDRPVPVSKTLRRTLSRVAPALVIAVIAVAIYSQQPAQKSPQVRTNATFVDATSLSAALARYRPVRPPLFPMTVRGLTQVGVPVEAVNPLFFAGLLAWAWWFVGRVAPRVSPVAPVALLALAHFNYPMLATLTSELMLTLLAALWMTALAAHLRTPGPYRHLWLSTLTAAACATRYVGLFWLLPLACVHLLARRGATPRRRLAEAATLAAITLAPVGAWMGHAYAKTGFVSGRDRFSLRENVNRSDLTGIDNALFTAADYVKTVLVDFFSTQTWASHQVVDTPYQANLLELFAAGLAVVTLGCAVGFLVQRSERPLQIRTRAAELLSSPSETTLLLETVVVFAAATLLLWTIGNNDRLYSRFLYPSYAFTLLIGFVVYWKICRAGAGLALRLPFSLLYVLLMAVHLFRSAWISRGR